MIKRVVGPLIMGLIVGFGVQALPVPPVVEILLLIGIFIVTGIAWIWLLDKWENRFKRGDRVFVTLQSGRIYEATVTGRIRFATVVTLVLDEYPDIPNVPFNRSELRRVP